MCGGAIEAWTELEVKLPSLHEGSNSKTSLNMKYAGFFCGATVLSPAFSRDALRRRRRRVKKSVICFACSATDGGPDTFSLRSVFPSEESYAEVAYGSDTPVGRR